MGVPVGVREGVTVGVAVGPSKTGVIFGTAVGESSFAGETSSHCLVVSLKIFGSAQVIFDSQRH